MIHYQAIEDLEERIEALRSDLGYYCPAPDKEAEMNAEIDQLTAELNQLKQEQEEYREGYDAGVQFHMDGTGMRDEWLGRFGAFRQGFDQAGQDS